MKVSTLNRFFNIAFGALAMIAVALLSAYLAMRFAIHGREVKVPALAGLSLSDAEELVSPLGLRLDVENRFYSAVIPAGAVISQSPAPGIAVRRSWAVRITQSLGPQQVSIPNLVGQTERPATITIRRLGLELGTVAHLPSPGPPGIILAQTPTPAATAVESPRISLLVSTPLPEPNVSRNPTESTTLPASNDATPGFAMPYLAGLTLSQAVARATSAGLHIVSAEDISTPVIPAPPTGQTIPVATAPTTRTVVAQSPPAGHRVIPGESVHLTLQ